MKVRHSEKKSEKIELQMTPMIDIVFQLLVFFIMTFKIVTPEGDFTIKMPLAAPSKGQPDPDMVPPMNIRLIAQPSGRLANIQMGQRSFSRNFDALNEEVLQMAGGPDGGPGAADALEAEIDADYNLRFEYVIDAISAVSGYVTRTPDGQPKIIKLVEKIKFAPPRPDPEG
jgi:biopolymer transport protein ExbD